MSGAIIWQIDCSYLTVSVNSVKHFQRNVGGLCPGTIRIFKYDTNRSVTINTTTIS